MEVLLQVLQCGVVHRPRRGRDLVDLAGRRLVWRGGGVGRLVEEVPRRSPWRAHPATVGERVLLLLLEYPLLLLLLQHLLLLAEVVVRLLLLLYLLLLLRSVVVVFLHHFVLVGPEVE